MALVDERKIDFSKVFGISSKDSKTVLPTDDLKGRCIDLMSSENVPLESENEFINA